MAVVTLPSQEARAQSNAQAESLNKKGKGLFKERRYLEAYRAFKQATDISPEGRYYFNLCFSLNYLERFQEAIDACEQVQPNGADDKLIKKTNAVLGALRAKVPAKPQPDPNAGDPNAGDPNAGDPNAGDPNAGDPNAGDPNAGDPNAGDPNAGDPNAGDPNAGDPNASVSTGPATVPGFDPFAEAPPAHAYEWSMGGGISPLANLGVGTGKDGGDSIYGAGGVKLNLFANFMFSKAQQIGVQGYLGFSNIAQANGPLGDAVGALSVVDLGGAAYKHFTISDKMDVTTLLGLHVAALQPDADGEDAFVSVGVRAQVSLDYALGQSREHVISFAPSLNFYGPSSDAGDLVAMDYGLDAGGATFEFGVAYQYRFTTPFGSSPLFTLE